MAEELFKKLTAMSSESLLKKNLTAEIFNKIKDKQTKFGGTVCECIKSGCLNPKSGVGCYASDPEAYFVFEDLLFPIIKDYHKVNAVEHPKPDMGDLSNLPFQALDKNLVVSTRVRVGRSHDSFGFPPVIDAKQRKEMEKLAVDAFKKLPSDLQGEYYSLENMSPEKQKELVELHFLFKDDDKYLRDAGGYLDWPIGRGIFFNKDRTFLVWVNEEDHLRFISMQQGGDLGEVYTRLTRAIKSLESSGLKFATHPKLGYLTFCPTNLGTALRASVHIKVPKLAAKKGKQPGKSALDELCAEWNLQPRGVHGEHTESEGGVYDISNKRRLGLTELEAVTEMYNGITEVIKQEKAL